MTQNAIELEENRNGVKRYSVNETVTEGDTVQLTVTHGRDDFNAEERESTMTVEATDHLKKTPSTENRMVVFKGIREDNKTVTVLAIGEVLVFNENDDAGTTVGELQAAQLK